MSIREVKILLFIIVVWRLGLEVVAAIGEQFVPIRGGFLGPSRWANLDGVHYLSIARNGYFTYEQAFFPVYPLLIKILATLTGLPGVWAGLIISHLAFIVGVIGWYRLGKELGLLKKPIDIWPLLLFPTSFFYIALYNESLFLAASVWSMWLINRRKWFVGSLLGGVAGGVRLFGVFGVIWVLIKKLFGKRYEVPWWTWVILLAGLIGYVIYLQWYFKDPIMFIHAQSAFGAGRSGSKIILLPQVIYRYLKIYLMVSAGSLNFWVAVFEGWIWVYGIYLLWINRMKKNLWPYLAFSAAVLIIPTLSGTLSSMPRYFLSAYPLFWLIAKREKWRDTITGVIFALILAVLTALFIRGYFIA